VPVATATVSLVACNICFDYVAKVPSTADTRRKAAVYVV
jgi:hypothetical protein